MRKCGWGGVSAVGMGNSGVQVAAQPEIHLAASPGAASLAWIRDAAGPTRVPGWDESPRALSPTHIPKQRPQGHPPGSVPNEHSEREF